MLDFSHLAGVGQILQAAKGDLQIFRTPATVTNVQLQVWRKPRGCSMLSIFGVGGGGGGGGGFTGTAASARGGGGGGGSSAMSSVSCLPLFLLPDALYIQVGAGGAGVSSGGGTASAGISSTVNIYQNNNNAGNSLFAANPGNGGGTGTAAAVGAAGNGGTVSSLASMNFAIMGALQSIAGQSGTAGGAIAGGNGVALTLPITGVLCTGGTGGAGTTSADFAGGSMSSPAGTWGGEQLPATPAAGSFNGSGGPMMWKPFFSFGGLGGSASNAGVGGQGGNAAHGSGGGGGGGGTTGGTGGKGGDGLVIMYCW